MTPGRVAKHILPAARVLLIAPHGSYRTTAFMQAARDMGVEVLLASEGKYSVISDYAEGLHLDFRDRQASLRLILEAADQSPFTAIIGTDDSTTELASVAAAELELPHNEPAGVRLTRRKDLARAKLSQAGVRLPQHRRLDLHQPLEPQLSGLIFPAVVKPIALSASRGVIRVDDLDALKLACQRIEKMLLAESQLESDSQRYLLLEQYIPGAELAVEGLLNDGRLQILTVFDKPEPMEGPFFEETYYITPTSLSDTQLRQLQQVIQQACEAYGLREGPIHAECRINEQGIWILEVAARTIGGMCGRLLQFGTGMSLETLVIRHALGLPVDVQRQQGAAGVLMIPIPRAGVLKRVEGLLKARRVKGIDDISMQIPTGHPVVPLPEGSSYLGFMFAYGDTASAVESALREAHACLNIVIDPLLPVAAMN